MTHPTSIAVWNTAFLGDAVLTLPLLRTIKAAFPNASIDLYVRKGLETLFAAQPEIRAVYGVSKKRSLPDMWKQLSDIRSRHYNVWISPHQSWRSAGFALFSGAKIRIGFSSGIQQYCYTGTIDRRFAQMDEIERVLNLTKSLFARFPEADPADFDPDDPVNDYHWPQLNLPVSAKNYADSLFAPLPSDRPVLGIHPGSVWPTKRWTPDGFAYCIQQAVEAGSHVFIFGVPTEREEVEAVLDKSGLRGNPLVHDMCGALTLPELAAVIAKLDVYLTNDSGPMHLAWCQHVAVTAVFGPTVRGLGFAPRGENSDIIEVDNLGCRPCGLHGKRYCPRGHFQCMNGVDPKAVWQNVVLKLWRAMPSE